MALVNFKDGIRFRSNNDLISVTSSKEMTAFIAESYSNIDVNATFSQLIDCGSLLQIALTAAGNDPCSTDVLKLTSRYQDIVADSMVLSTAFVTSALQALHRHSLAMSIIQEAEDKEDVNDAIDYLVQCSTLADAMATKTADLVIKVTELTDLAEIALISANNSQVLNVQQKKFIEEKIAKLKAETEASKATMELLDASLAEARRKESKLEKQAAQARDRQFQTEMIGAVIGGLSSAATLMNPTAALAASMGGAANSSASGSESGSETTTATVGVDITENTEKQSEERAKKEELATLEIQLEAAQKADDKDTVDGKKKIEDLQSKVKLAQDALAEVSSTLERISQVQAKQVQTLEELEAQATEVRIKLDQEKRERAGALAKSLQEMSTMKADKSQVEQAVITLGTCKQTLGMIKTTFNNVRIFWVMIKDKCDGLAAFKDDYELVAGGSKLRKNIIIEVVENSALHWAGLGRVCLNANTAIETALERVNGAMNRLPSQDATDREVQNLISELLPNMLQITTAEPIAA